MSITTVLLSCLISHMALPMLASLLEAKPRLYLHLYVLDVTQGLHILCSFTFNLDFVLFIKRKVSFPIALHRLFDDSQNPLILFVAIVHFKDFLILQDSPDGKQRQFLFMFQDSCRKHGTPTYSTDVNRVILSRTST